MMFGILAGDTTCQRGLDSKGALWFLSRPAVNFSYRPWAKSLVALLHGVGRIAGGAPRASWQGAGQALTSTCIARARQDNANAIGLFTGELMQPAHHVYRTLGFHPESELPTRFGIRYFRFVLRLGHIAKVG